MGSRHQHNRNTVLTSKRSGTVGTKHLEPSLGMQPEVQTLTIKEVPFVFREPHILTGYRLPEQSWGYYLRSLFWLHNETVNVWSHLVGVALIVIQALILGQYLDYTSESRAWPVLWFTVASCMLDLSSAVAHLFQSKSPLHHYVFYFIDYAGVTFYNLGNGVIAIYSFSHPHTYRWLESTYLGACVLLCWLSFLLTVQTKLRYEGHFNIKRKLAMLAVFVVKSLFFLLPIMPRYYDCLQDTACSLSSLDHLSIVMLFFLLDGLFFAIHYPEKWRPGWFDLFGHGHQLFHFSVLATQLLQFRALHVDVVQMQMAQHAKPSLMYIASAFVVLFVFEGISLLGLNTMIARKVTNDDMKKDSNT